MLFHAKAQRFSRCHLAIKPTRKSQTALLKTFAPLREINDGIVGGKGECFRRNQNSDTGPLGNQYCVLKIQ